MNKLKTYLLLAIVGISGIVIGAVLFGNGSTTHTMDEHIAETHTNELGEVVYTCSMHPQIRQNEPGNCPICGMDLIAAENNFDNANPNSLVMSKAALALAEIETTPVVSAIATEQIRVPGKVSINQNNSSSVTSHLKGRIIDLYVDFEGAFVQKGQRMASIYSPELVAAQQELLETAKVKTQNPTLYEAARRKLELWELPVATINQIEASEQVMESVDIVSPVSGYVQSVFVDREQHVMAGSMMYQIVDLSSVWVMFDIYEQDITKVEEGDELSFSTMAVPGRTFTSTIDYIDPIVSNDRRVIEVRSEVPNVGNRLKPNMLVEGVIESSSKEPKLLIPTSAVLWTGKRSLVFVQEPNTTEPTFTAREIVLGERAGDQYIVIEGLAKGERVVTNGTFKLDSAAQLADKRSMMNPSPGSGNNQTGHGHHASPSHTANQAASIDHSQNLQSGKRATEDQQQHTHTEHLDSLVAHYLVMKDALVADDFEAAQTALVKFAQEARTNDDMNNHGEHGAKHKNHHDMMLEAIASAEDATSIEEFRTAFIDISKELLTAIENQDYQHPSLFIQFCPMANSNKGAQWISNTENIANPFYGQMMHNCGETVNKIE